MKRPTLELSEVDDGPAVDEKGAAEFLGVEPWTLQKWRYQKAGPPYVKYGTKKSSPIRYPMAGLRAFRVAASVDPSTAEAKAAER